MSTIGKGSIPQLPPRGRAEKKELAPKLALLDDFDGDEQGFPHGQAVESVLFNNSDLGDQDVQRYQNQAKQADLTKLIKEDGLDFLTAYRTVVARNIGHFYLSTAANLQTIVQEQPTIKVVSQSQGETPGRLLEGLFQGLQQNQAFRDGVCHNLGFPLDAPLAKICEKLLAVADLEAAQNEMCKKAKNVYDQATKTLHDKGITYLVAAGNHGDFGQSLNALGIETSSSLRNVLVNDYVTVVGANDEQGNISTLNSPGGAAEVFRRGENLAWQVGEGFDRQGVDSGTSFATPLAAAESVKIYQQEAEATPFQVEAKLAGLDSTQVRAGQAKATSNGQSLIGDGQLEPYILDKIGPGFLYDIASSDLQQIAQAKQDNAFFGLPGNKDHEFQLVKMRTEADGVRKLTLDTYFDEGYHRLTATAQDGAWQQESVIESLHLDKKRQKEIESASQKSVS